ncbi:J domain-containing protein [Myroides phaeus]|uniref:DnaJ domain-containing protein n=1 Tax=Myroides phaeus TaxID=702745 RepID=A0A1G8H9I8_9FLAO|nr:J domain-containing protein [Myroides phaeus]MEC4117856.1 J domain-containing protein [Myroides phaeus]SDI03316.1 DnaJ domain-containing protein [Myroides phaeus]
MNKRESYTILGLEENASIDEIKVAYRKLTKQYHPDKTGGDEFLTNMFKKINTAYNTLLSSSSTSSEFNQQNANSYSSTQSNYKRVVFNPEIEKWIKNHHKIAEQINSYKSKLSYFNKTQPKKNLSISNIAKLVGAAFLIILFFSPFQSESAVTPAKNFEQASWQTSTATKLFKVPDIQTSPIATLGEGHKVDSISTTKYFFKVNVTTESGVMTGYILKDNLKK